jgi:hypothetical protein
VNKHKSIQTKESSKKKNLNKSVKFHICCFCNELFATVEEVNAHIIGCSLAGKLEAVVALGENK